MDYPSKPSLSIPTPLSPSVFAKCFAAIVLPLSAIAISARAELAFEWDAAAHIIYVTGEGTATLTEIKQALPAAELTLVDVPGRIWHLESDLVVRDGATLQLHGGAGDVNELRLKSQPQGYVYLKANWGTLDLNGVTITSWDSNTGAPDQVLGDGRAYILAQSRMEPSRQEGAWNSTLNVVNSSLEALGMDIPYRYALNWHLVNSANPGASYTVDLMGEVTDNTFQHCVISAPSWGIPTIPYSGNNYTDCQILDYDSNDAKQLSVYQTSTLTNPNMTPDVATVAGKSSRILITGPGRTTLAQMASALSANFPSYLVHSGNEWLITIRTDVENGAQLLLHGNPNDRTEQILRLQSDTSGASPPKPAYIAANWGYISLRDMTVTSWNTLTSSVDEGDTSNRGYIRADSALLPDGHSAQESRMDVTNCVISYLGYEGSKAYGLSWKVEGYVDTNPEVFDIANVYGDIKDSEIHHCHYAVYTWGAEDCWWENNDLHDNVVYGFDPHDDSDYILIRNNRVWNNGKHGIIASKRCNHVQIINNESWGNTPPASEVVEPIAHGIMLHYLCHDGLIQGNTVYDNFTDGIAIYASHRTLVRDNICHDNARGIRLSAGSSDCIIYGNNITDSVSDGISLYYDDDPELVFFNDGRPKRNRFGGWLDLNGDGFPDPLPPNVITNPGAAPIRLAEADDNLFEANVINSGNSIRVEACVNNYFRGNTPSVGLDLDTASSSPRALSGPASAISYAEPLLSGGVIQPSSVGSFSRPLLTVTPNRKEVIAEIVDWNTQSLTSTKSWTTDANTNTQTFLEMTIGGLAGNATYSLYRDNVLVRTDPASPAGVINYTNLVINDSSLINWELRFVSGETEFTPDVTLLSGGTEVQVSFDSADIYYYLIQESHDLSVWTSLHCIHGTNSPISMTYPFPDPRVFYRVFRLSAP